MRWEDLVITIGQIAFIIALVPTIKSKNKPPIFTSVVSGVFLMVFAFAQQSLGLLASTVSSTILGIGWLYVGYQTYQQDKKK